MKEKILASLSAECPWRGTLHWYEDIDSTNTQARRLARAGAPHGTVLIAGHQTGGKGRLGRTFQSPAGAGVYLSVLLRPGCPAEELMHLTCAAGVAMVQAVEQVSGVRPGIKWINDLVVERRKLGGILTELSIEKGMVDYAILGIGINCLQREEDFAPELAGLAISLSQAAGYTVLPEKLAAAMIEALWNMSQTMFSEKTRYLSAYKECCITLGKDVQILRDGQVRPAKAIDLDQNGGLLVQYPDGARQVVSSGEVSVRGLYGYV